MFEEKKNALILIKKNISTDLLSKNYTVSEKAKHKIQNSQQNILGKHIVSFWEAEEILKFLQIW